MKNANIMIALILLALTIATSAIASNEEKSKVTLINKVLPASLPVLDSPAPQRVSLSAESTKTAIQKANIVELKLKSIDKK
ncbi:hypothetical protein [Dyadobacter sp. CY356]|uniref:hypothetical protein n=1 Tax=Dyadobacter sp. CY356 TaxID=2906442 RepID=UPI001F25E40D|nr:hypothetical protein [Dyadobacter sp. CY356]MCF0055999.1 hypothetical protein [Dyadobacter sp. CY356]